MKNNAPFIAIVLAAFLLLNHSLLLAQKTPVRKYGKGACSTGSYRNLFKENGYSDKEIQLKINNAFQQLFYGDTATRAIYCKAGRNNAGALAYIYDVFNQDIRSEGMSYGMMITLQLNKKAEFDALWNYAMTYMYISKKKHPAEGYFAWSIKKNGIPNAEGPAPDGEEYMVTALYMAAARWGNGSGMYNYQAWADSILKNMRHHPVTTGPTSFGTATIGSMVNEEKKMILFVPQSNNPAFTDPSYHLPAFYEIWAICGPKEDRLFWSAAADTSRAYFHKATHPVTGLSSDYADFEGKPVVTKFNKDSDKFAYDSWRTAMNWSVDWSWWQKDPHQKELSDRIQDFFKQQGINTYGGVYTPDGKPVRNGHPSGLVAANAVVSLASPHPAAKEFVDALWNLPVPQHIGERYYGGLLYLMSLLHCSGQFKVYMPQLASKQS